VITAKDDRKAPREYDKALYKVRQYKARHLIETVFAQLKQYRSIATCCDASRNVSLCYLYGGCRHLAELMTCLRSHDRDHTLGTTERKRLHAEC
jgi:transposase